MNPDPQLSRRALILAACFSALVWAVCIAALCRAFVRDVVP